MTDMERYRYIAHLLINRPKREPLLLAKEYAIIVGLVDLRFLTKSQGHQLRTALAEHPIVE